MGPHLTRRQALAGLAAVTVAGRVGAGARHPDLFSHGVASGDPDYRSVVLWTRVAPVRPRLEVRWTIAEDAAFERIVNRGAGFADADRDHTVKVVAGGLEAGRSYFYRFEAAGTVSPVGRTRTLPVGRLESLVLALASCSNFPFGYFNAYEAIARDPEVEFVVHLGDYIYEYGSDGYGAQVGAVLGRVHAPRREIVTLADYRERHAQYKAEPGSRALHAAHPLIALWDDHESANNPWTGGAENHQDETEGAWPDRLSASLRAWYEWMPVREPEKGGSRTDYWRHLQFGDLASLVTLETRHTGRSRQIEYGSHLPEIRSVEEARRFMREVVGAPGRNMLSSAMEAFLRDALSESRQARRPWRLIGNQIPMARVHVPPLPERGLEAASADELAHLRTLGRFDLPLYLDPWDGYPDARARFYALCAGEGARDLLVLTGDSHAFWFNELFDDAGEGMGLEIGTTSITSPGDFEAFGPEGAALLDNLIASHNPEVVWTDNRHRGYVRLRLDHQLARADYVAVGRIDVPRFRTEVLRSVTIRHQGGGLRYSG